MGDLQSISRWHNPAWLWMALAVWLAAVCCCWGRLAAYSYGPGPLARPPVLDLVGGPIRPAGTSHLLVMAIHPRCPCSRASVGEFERLLTRFRRQLSGVVLVYQPAAAPDDWLQTDIVEHARRLPGVEIVVDAGGALADNLGMKTSGATVLYSPRGTPEYWGGITPARGHAGDNLGSDAIAAAARGESAPLASQPAYGCQIRPLADEVGK